MDDGGFVQSVEILKRPGQSLGFYIREGNGRDRSDGVFISRVASGSVADQNRLLRIGDEILSVNDCDVRGKRLDDVVVAMSVQKRLLLTVRTQGGIASAGAAMGSETASSSSLGGEEEDATETPVVVIKGGRRCSSPMMRTAKMSEDAEDGRRYRDQGNPMGRFAIQGQPDLLGYLAAQGQSSSIGKTHLCKSNLQGSQLQGQSYLQGYSFRGDSNLLGYQSQNQSNVSGYQIQNQSNTPAQSAVLRGFPVQQFLQDSQRTQDIRRSPIDRNCRTPNGTLDDVDPYCYRGQWNEPGNQRHSLIRSTWVGRRSVSPNVEQRIRRTSLCEPEDKFRDRTLGDARRSIQELLLPRIAFDTPVSRFVHTQSCERTGVGGLSSGLGVGGVGLGFGGDSRIGIGVGVGSGLAGGNGIGAVGVDVAGGGDDSGDSGLSSDNSSYFRPQEFGTAPPKNVPAVCDISESYHSSSSPRGVTNSTGFPRTSSSNDFLGYYDSGTTRRLLDYSSDTELGKVSNRTPSSKRLNVSDRSPLLGPADGYQERTRELPTFGNFTSSPADRLEHSGQMLIRLDEGSKERTPGDRERGFIMNSWLKSFESLSFDRTTFQRRVPDGLHLKGDRDEISANQDIKFIPPSSTTSFTISSRPSISSHLSFSSRPVAPIECLAPRQRLTRKLSTGSIFDHPAYGTGDDDPILRVEPRPGTSYGLGAGPPSGSHRGIYSELVNPGETPEGACPGQRPMWSTQKRRSIALGEGLRSGGGDVSRSPLEIRKDAFTVFAPPASDECSDSESGVGRNGMLSCHVFCGQGLAPRSPAALQDLYCVLEVDSLGCARTTVHTGATNFDWDERFEVDLHDARILSFIIYAWSPYGKHRAAFHAVLQLRCLDSPADRHRLAMGLAPRGTLYVEVTYRTVETVFRRGLSVRAQATFGADLESVVERERGRGLGVPAVVWRCVEEIQRRGMEQAGVYRVSGSSERKERLKEEMDRCPWTTELSHVAVPDINVITALLKDYFRELPDAICGAGLYDVLMDAHSVQLPGDTEGNAQLMLSIVDCMPKTNQATLSLLLDHLKAVSLKSSVNRMTSADLGTCFGAILFHPSTYSSSSASLWQRCQPRHFARHADLLRYIIDIWPQKRLP